jgi:hypothetical protein
MIDSFKVINLRSLLDKKDAEGISDLLSVFSCPQNQDIETFLKDKSIGFAQQGIAQTHLVFGKESSHFELLGFFALTLKTLDIPASMLNKTYEKRASKFGVLTERAVYSIPVPLIAQLGKNYCLGIHGHISGEELLAIACNKVRTLQMEMGGRFVYIECEDTPFLTDFYAANGFRRVSPTILARGELVQMIRYQ